jgi:hypothetical protein
MQHVVGSYIIRVDYITSLMVGWMDGCVEFKIGLAITNTKKNIHTVDNPSMQKLEPKFLM